MLGGAADKWAPVTESARAACAAVKPSTVTTHAHADLSRTKVGTLGVQVLGLHWSLATPTLVQQACRASQRVPPNMRPNTSMVSHQAVLTLPASARASGAFWHPGITRWMLSVYCNPRNCALKPVALVAEMSWCKACQRLNEA